MKNWIHSAIGEYGGKMEKKLGLGGDGGGTDQRGLKCVWGGVMCQTLCSFLFQITEGVSFSFS